MMIYRILFCCLFLGLVSSPGAPPANLDEELARDNPKVIKYLKGLTEDQKNKPLGGVKLSDGTIELKGAVFIASRELPAKKQHLFLFKEEGSYRAYVWIDAGGKTLSIPVDKKGSPGENAAVLSGDVFTYTEMSPGDGLVILYGATPAWLEKQ